MNPYVAEMIDSTPACWSYGPGEHPGEAMVWRDDLKGRVTVRLRGNRWVARIYPRLDLDPGLGQRHLIQGAWVLASGGWEDITRAVTKIVKTRLRREQLVALPMYPEKQGYGPFMQIGYMSNMDLAVRRNMDHPGEKDFVDLDTVVPTHFFSETQRVFRIAYDGQLYRVCGPFSDGLLLLKSASDVRCITSFDPDEGPEFVFCAVAVLKHILRRVGKVPYRAA